MKIKIEAHMHSFIISLRWSFEGVSEVQREVSVFRQIDPFKMMCSSVLFYLQVADIIS